MSSTPFGVVSETVTSAVAWIGTIESPTHNASSCEWFSTSTVARPCSSVVVAVLRIISVVAAGRALGVKDMQRILDFFCARRACDRALSPALSMEISGVGVARVAPWEQPLDAVLVRFVNNPTLVH